MNKKLLMTIVILVLCCAVAAGGIAAVKAIKDRSNTPHEVSDPVENTDPSGQTGQQGQSGPQTGDNTQQGQSGNESQFGNEVQSGNTGSTDAEPGDKITAYLLMGIDKSAQAGDVDYYYGGGQSDVMNLLVFNDTKKTFTQLQIDRDTITDIDVLGVYGDPYTTENTFICFAYAMGNGTEKSAENAVRAVSRMLGGVKVDGYAAMTYAGVAPVNDTLGGICVTIEEDLTSIDSVLQEGKTVELKGETATNFIRARMSVGDGKNTSRMRRQRAYLSAFEKRLFEEIKVRSKIVDDLYNAAKPYMVTNMSSSQMTKIAIKASQYTSLGTVNIEGRRGLTNYKDKVYTALFPDEDALRELVKKLFGNVSF